VSTGAFYEGFDGDLSRYASTAFEASGGKLAALDPEVGGQLVVSELEAVDSVQSLRIEVGPTERPYTELLLKRLDANNYVSVRVRDTGSATILGLIQRDEGSATVVDEGSINRLTLGASYRFYGVMVGNVVKMAVWREGASNTVDVRNYTLVGAGIGKYGVGVAGGVGLNLVAEDAGNAWDDHLVAPLG
jgi:hypothetical protein